MDSATTLAWLGPGPYSLAMRLDSRRRKLWPGTSGRAVSGLLLVLTAACGTTVPGAGLGAASDGTASGTGASAGTATGLGAGGAPAQLAAGGSTPSGFAPGSSTGSGTVSLPGATGAARGPGSTVGTGRTAGGGPAPAPRTSGFGFSAKEIRIGVAYNGQLSQQMGAAGAAGGGAVLGNQKNQVEALARDINAHGGIAGRKLVPVFYDTNGQQNNISATSQAACAAWTEDNSVFAAMTFVAELSNDTMYGCLAKHGVVFAPLAGESVATYRRFAPYLWTPTSPSADRIGVGWVQRLAALKYFTGWDTTFGTASQAPVKVGLLLGNGARDGEPSLDRALERSLRSEMGRLGIPVAATFNMTTIDQGSSAVLRFKDAGVTHVIGDFSIALFAQSAESQRYRPRYGISSLSGGIALPLYVPSVQLNGALGIGWSPQGDVDAGQDPGDVSAAEPRCRKVMQDAGEPTDSRLAWFVMAFACDTFSFFDKALEASGLQPANMPAAAAAIGALPPVSTFGIAFPGGRNDGAAYVRDVAYQNGCSCFAYVDKTNRAI